MYFYIKIFIDTSVSVFLLIFLLPLLIITYLIILIFDRVNPIFSQTRSGLKKNNFKIYKFNSMKIIDGNLKITKVGKIIRKFKIDELPQLANVFKGDMSLIGPRPLYPDFNNFYQKEHLKRFNVKPGITGLAQVSVEDSTKWHIKFKYDVFYTKKLSLLLDLKIIISTIKLLYFSILNKKNIKEVIDYKENFFSSYAKK
jgi:undecaprenyl phosphate N,N'-diacetylbacillosamine 1-phosphate transferase